MVRRTFRWPVLGVLISCVLLILFALAVHLTSRNEHGARKQSVPTPTNAEQPIQSAVQPDIEPGARTRDLPAPESATALNDDHQGQYAQWRRKWPKTFERIEVQREILAKESLEESLALLDDVEFYRWPAGGPNLPPGAPKGIISATHERFALDTILSNRRFRKILTELKAVPRAQAAELINRALYDAWPRYETLYEEKFGALLEYVSSYDPENPTGWGYSLEPKADGGPALYAAAHELLALSLIAGELELRESHTVLLFIADETVRRRDAIYGLGNEFPNSPVPVSSFLTQLGMYNRTVLGTALVRTSHDGVSELPEEFVSSHAWQTRELVSHRATVTEFDLPVRYGVPPDRSQGTSEISLLSNLDDQAFDRILNSVWPE